MPRGADLDLAAYVGERDRVQAAVEADVAAGLDGRLPALHHLVWHRRKRQEAGTLGPFELFGPAPLALLEWPRVYAGDAGAHCLVELRQGEERPVPERGDHILLDDADGALDGGLVARPCSRGRQRMERWSAQRGITVGISCCTQPGA